MTFFPFVAVWLIKAGCLIHKNNDLNLFFTYIVVVYSPICLFVTKLQIKDENLLRKRYL